MKRCLLLLSAILSAQTSLQAPPLARVLDAEGLLTPVFGLAGNFVSGLPGPALLAYSYDGDVEWRLEPGRLSATRDGRTALFATDATSAAFHGAFATLPESGQTLRYNGDTLALFFEEPDTRIAGRAIRWKDGKLLIVQADGAVEEVACSDEPGTMTAAAADWIHLSLRGQSHLLRLTPGRVELFVLPQRRRE